MSKPLAAPYQTFVLRFWSEENTQVQDCTTNWRFVLIDPVSGERTSFTTLEDLNTYLIKLMKDAGNAMQGHP